MVAELCPRCAHAHVERQQANATIITLRAENAALISQLTELAKVNELQAADLDRYKKFIAGQTAPHQPERVARDTLQLAFQNVVESLQSKPLSAAVDVATEAADALAAGGAASTPPARKGNRRNLLDSNLPIVEDRIVPDEVLATNGVGWREIEPEITSRVAHRRAQFVIIRTTRTKWIRIDTATGHAEIVVAPVPDWALPSLMADSSVIVTVITQKYGVSQPLNRQEKTSAWHGFHLPRSTQADWCDYAHGALSPIVTAMHAESMRDSFQVSTDATSAPVRAVGGVHYWHLFVFIGDVGHITFRHVRHHDGDSIKSLLRGFSGRLLSDAASIYGGLRALGITSVACWVHARRYFWKATLTESTLAHEALSLIDTLFKIDAQSKRVPRAVRGAFRAEHAAPVLAAFDTWTTAAQARAETGGRIAAALTYYSNQREALRRFLDDGRLDLHNNASERELRALVMGRHNWMHFETKTGLAWYATFRSLIASCLLHHLNPLVYLEEVLRLVRHWPEARMIELSPRHWPATRAALDPRLRRAIEPIWREREAQRIRTAA